MAGSLYQGSLGLLFLLTTLKLHAAHLDDVLHTYETLHPAHIRHRVVKRDLTSTAPAVRQVEFTALGRHFHLYLQKKRSLLSPTFRVVAVNGKNHEREVSLEDSQPFEGHLIGEEGTSRVHAVWEDEDNMAASITTKGAAIFVEPSWRHLPHSDNYSMIVYRKEDIKLQSDLGMSFCGSMEADDPKPRTAENDHPEEQHEHSSRSRRDALPQSGAPEWTSCEVLLVADYLFYKDMGHSSLSKTSAYLIGLLDRIDAMYRRTDFGHGFKGMGFQIKEIRIHESYTDPTGHDPPHYNEHVNKTWETNLLLEVFTQTSSRAYCLAHLFTARGSWHGNVATLGLSYVASPKQYKSGGVCTKDNTGWSTTLNRHGRRLLTQEADFVTAHEFGHNWGSPHDPNTAECSPSAFKGGKYIMYTYSVTGYDDNNQLFSSCSKRSIGAVLKNKANQCFERRSASFCGNTHVESDEECDVGPEGQKGAHPCCDEHCRLRSNATCSDVNDLSCSGCQYANSDTVCHELINDAPTCDGIAYCTGTSAKSPLPPVHLDVNDLCCSGCQYANSDTVCHELINDAPTCDGIAHCTGTSAKCPPPDQKMDGSPCLHRGQCLGGKCLPFCQTKGLVSCICDEVETACTWCCKADDNSTCEPYIKDPSENLTLPLPDGMPCIQGSCDQGKCQKQVTDIVKRIWKIIENITPDQVVEFMRTNIVGTVIVLSLFVWIPVSCVISWKDRKMLQDQREINNWMRYDNTLLFKANDPKKVRPARALSRQYLQRSTGNTYGPGQRPLLAHY